MYYTWRLTREGIKGKTAAGFSNKMKARFDLMCVSLSPIDLWVKRNTKETCRRDCTLRVRWLVSFGARFYVCHILCYGIAPNLLKRIVVETQMSFVCFLEIEG